MAMTEENYFFRTSAGGSDCLGEDDDLGWRASGSLAPGESFTFTPKVTGCYAHPAVVSVVATWSAGSLELSTDVPDSDFSSWDPGQRGRHILAPTVDSKAQLCMFPYYRESGQTYSIRLTNRGTETVNGIQISGRSENDWPIYYYPRCLNADADGDGWNDALEHTMALLTYYSSGGPSGANYLRASAATGTTGDEVDANPADLDDDGDVDAADLLLLQAQVGAGNGIPLERISPNPSEAAYLYTNAQAWRRFDLDGDGWVDGTDVDLLAALVDQPVPMGEDILAPTARLIEPKAGATVPRGQQVRLIGHAWDNAALTRVDYLVDGRTLCAQTEAVPSFGTESPLFSCWWQVPNKAGSYSLSVRAYDAAGHTTTSAPVRVSAQ